MNGPLLGLSPFDHGRDPAWSPSPYEAFALREYHDEQLRQRAQETRQRILQQAGIDLRLLDAQQSVAPQYLDPTRLQSYGHQPQSSPYDLPSHDHSSSRQCSFSPPLSARYSPPATEPPRRVSEPKSPSSASSGISKTRRQRSRHASASEPTPFQCFDHGCNGRSFSCAENFRRHVREQSREITFECPRCHNKFSRRGNRDLHVSSGRCRAPVEP